MKELPENLVEIARSPDETVLHEYGLVILSMGEPYWVDQEQEEFLLLVEEGAADEIDRQLDLYERESANWPPVAPEMAEDGASITAAMLWLMVMTLAYGVSHRWPVLYDHGKASAEAIMEGQLYRTVTALLLHADLGHLAGNLLFGAVFIHLVAGQIGTVWAWFGVFLAGACGNFLNAWLYFPNPHYSVGASTAVFGAIGLLFALPVGFWIRHAPHQVMRFWTMPIVIGLIFLAWFGTGSEGTDTSAHLMGFVCGLPVGLIAGWLFARPAKVQTAEDQEPG